MKIIIDNDIINKYDVSVDDTLILLAIYHKVHLDDILRDLEDKNMINIEIDPFSGLRKVTLKRAGLETINNILRESGNNLNDVKAIDQSLKNIPIIARKLKDIFPKGKRDNKYYWAEGVMLIEKRLKTFYKKYGRELKVDEVVDAAQRYVDSFKGNYRYMKLLKYYIFKEKAGAAGDVESESDLLTMLENKDEIPAFDEDWANTLV